MYGSESAGGKEECVAILKSLESAMLEANKFPNIQQLEILHVTSPAFRKSGKHLNKRLVSIIRAVALRYAVINKTDSDSASSTSTASLTPRDHLHDETLETTEETLECFNAALDTARGIKNAIVQPNGALSPNPTALKIGLGYLGKRHGGFLDIEKPQIHFPDYPIDNSDNPFIPPYNHTSNHARFAEDDPTTQHVHRHLQDLFRNNSNHEGERRHPYEEEISNAATEMASKMFTEENTIVYGSLEEIPCTMVTTDEELFNVAERLKRVSEIAVDLENHSIRSFQGFTCLIQISTRREDFVIDALKLRGSINRALAPVFTDETIVKVLHGADKDVQWLERDFGIYVVNMFDTGQAARLLKLPSAALSFLLAKYCDVTGGGTSKKKFQLADWRQRPLPKDMFDYARSDTHYLLYIYDRVRSELSKLDLLAESWVRSSKISRKRHSKTRYDPYMAGHLAARHGLGFDGHQLRLLQALFKWRDATAREEDESLVYVAPLHTLFGIVRARDTARTVPGLLKHGFPMRQVPLLIYKHAEAITRYVSDALDAKLEKISHDIPMVNESRESKFGKILQSMQRHAEELNDGAVGQVISNISTTDEKTGEVQTSSEISAVADLKKSPERTTLPDAKLRKLSKCAFFDSDSESDSDCVEEKHHTRHFGDENLASDTEKKFEKEEEQSAQMEGTEAETKSSEDGQVKGSKADSEQCGSFATTKGVFDLSDSCDESEERVEADWGRMKAAQVAKDLQVELAEKVKNLKSAKFETELQARKREQEELVRKEQAIEEKRIQEETREELEEKFVSILESTRRKDGNSTRRRKKKRVREDVVETERLDAFDYSMATKEMQLRKDGRRRQKSFDPMEGLKGQRGMTGRSGAKRRRRGRGKSMSFAS